MSSLQEQVEKLIKHGNAKFGLNETTLRGIIDNATTGGTEGKSLFAQRVDNSLTEVYAKDLEGITTIGMYAFQWCQNLTTVELPNSITSIGTYAFYCCRVLKSVTLSNKLVNIYTYAFYDCRKLPKITLPSTVKRIDTRSFYDCAALTEMTILATVPPTLVNTNAISSSTTTIYIPHGTLSAYQSATNWSSFADKFVELNQDGSKP